MKPQEIKKIREELGMTQADFARALEVNIRTVQKWEGGETKIRKGSAFLVRSMYEGRNASRSLEIRRKYAPLDVVKHIEDFFDEYIDYPPFLRLAGRVNKKVIDIAKVKEEISQLQKKVDDMQKGPSVNN